MAKVSKILITVDMLEVVADLDRRLMHLSHPIQILMPPFLKASVAENGGAYLKLFSANSLLEAPPADLLLEEQTTAAPRTPPPASSPPQPAHFVLMEPAGALELLK
jgi:hypothetical protein